VNPGLDRDDRQVGLAARPFDDGSLEGQTEAVAVAAGDEQDGQFGQGQDLVPAVVVVGAALPQREWDLEVTVPGLAGRRVGDTGAVLPLQGDDGRVGGLSGVSAAVTEVQWHSSGKMVMVGLEVEVRSDPNAFEAFDRYWIDSRHYTPDPIDRSDDL
jgi:hypothetical protein